MADLLAHDGLELARAELPARVAEAAAGGDAAEVRRRHVDAGPEVLQGRGKVRTGYEGLRLGCGGERRSSAREGVAAGGGSGAGKMQLPSGMGRRSLEAEREYHGLETEP